MSPCILTALFLLALVAAARAEPPASPRREIEAFSRSEPLLTLRGGEHCLAYSPDGKVIAVPNRQGGVVLWDAEEGKKLTTLEGLRPQVLCVAWSPDGKHVAAGGWDAALKVWDVSTGKVVASFESKEQWQTLGVCFSPDGKCLAIARDDAVVLDLAAKKEVLRIAPVDKGTQVHCVAFSPDGKQLALGGESSILLCEAAGGQKLHVLGGIGEVSWVSFSPTGRRLAAVGHGGAIKVWEVRTGVETATLSTGSKSLHSHHVVAFSPDGRRLAATAWYSRIVVWDLGSGQEVLNLEKPHDHVGHLAFRPDGRRLAACGEGGERSIRVWDVSAGAGTWTIAGGPGPVHGIAFSPDSKQIACASGEAEKPGEVKVRDAATGQEQFTLKGHKGRVSSVIYSPDGKLIAAGGDDRTVRVWDAATGKLVVTLEGSTGSLDRIAFSPDGKRLAASSLDQTARVWDIASGKVVFTLLAPKNNYAGETISVAWSPDGKQIATGGGDHTVRLWDAATGKETQAWKTTGEVRALIFSPDGKHLAVSPRGNPDQSPAHLRDLATSKEVVMASKEFHLRGLALSPDGKLLAGAGKGGVVLWDASTGRHLGTFRGQGDARDVAFSPDGKRLASGGADGTLKVREVHFGPDPRNWVRRLDLTGKELDAAWSDLAGTDAVLAQRAVFTLADGENAVKLLAERVKPVLPLSDDHRKKARAWIDQLDSNHFTTRERATEELVRLGPGAAPLLREALKGTPTTEAKGRLEGVLSDFEAGGPDLGAARLPRALEVLELRGDPVARRLLEALAAGVNDARLTREAQASLERLRRREEKAP
jgi:WD40 repeat protein